LSKIDESLNTDQSYDRFNFEDDLAKVHSIVDLAIEADGKIDLSIGPLALICANACQRMINWTEADDHYSELTDYVGDIAADLDDASYDLISESLDDLYDRFVALIKTEHDESPEPLIRSQFPISDLDDLCARFPVSELVHVPWDELSDLTKQQVTDSGMRWEWYPDS
jgi:hypothetical protein